VCSVFFGILIMVGCTCRLYRVCSPKADGRKKCKYFSRDFVDFLNRLHWGPIVYVDPEYHSETSRRFYVFYFFNFSQGVSFVSGTLSWLCELSYKL